MTFYPRYRKAYALQLRCRSASTAVGAVGAVGTVGGRPSSGSGPGTLRLPPLAGAPAADADGAAIAGAGRGTGAGQGSGSGVGVQGPVVVCPLAAQASFPAVVATDAFCEGVPKPVGVYTYYTMSAHIIRYSVGYGTPCLCLLTSSSHSTPAMPH